MYVLVARLSYVRVGCASVLRTCWLRVCLTYKLVARLSYVLMVARLSYVLMVVHQSYVRIVARLSYVRVGRASVLHMCWLRVCLTYGLVARLSYVRVGIACE